MIRVSDEETQQALLQENPWWEELGGILPPRFQAVEPRLFLPDFHKLVTAQTPRREVILLGPRRVGKTFLIHHSIAQLIAEGVDPLNILYLSIDNPLYVGLSLEQLLAHYQSKTGVPWRQKTCYIFFDEIQYLKDWEVHLKSLHDAGTPTRFIASGSANAALNRGSKESGAGRFTDFLLPPLTFVEYLNFRNQEKLVEGDADGFFSPDIDALNEELIRYLNFGGYPEIALLNDAEEHTARYMRSDIIDKVLLRDLPSLYGISDGRELNRLFTMLAFNSAHELSLNDLSKDSAVTKTTLRRYLEYLEAAFLIRPIMRVDQSAKRFQREGAYKLYLTNPSLRTGLFAPITATSEHLGSAVETGIFAQRFHNAHENLHYARWKSGQKQPEIDLVELDPAMRVREVVEIKFTDRVVKQTNTWKPWTNFCRKNNAAHLLITTRTEDGIAEQDGVQIRFEPSALYCYRLGAANFNSRQ